MSLTQFLIVIAMCVSSFGLGWSVSAKYSKFGGACQVAITLLAAALLWPG